VQGKEDSYRKRVLNLLSWREGRKTDKASIVLDISAIFPSPEWVDSQSSLYPSRERLKFDREGVSKTVFE
jgi:hypothetical protein